MQWDKCLSGRHSSLPMSCMANDSSYTGKVYCAVVSLGDGVVLRRVLFRGPCEAAIVVKGVVSAHCVWPGPAQNLEHLRPEVRQSLFQLAVDMFLDGKHRAKAKRRVRRRFFATVEDVWFEG